MTPKRGYLDPSPEVVEAGPRGARPRGDRLRPLQCRLRARRGRPARRSASAPRTGATSTSSPARYPEARGRRQRALRPGRPHRHRSGLGGRPRRRPAPDAPAVRCPGRRDGRAPDGRASAPRRRAGAVHRPAGARLRVRVARPAAGVDQRAPRRRARRGPPGAPDAHVAAHLRPPLQGGDRHDAVQLDPRAAACRPPRSCSSRPTTPIDWIAGEVGFGNAATLRHHFGRSRGVSPQEYRRTFCMHGLTVPDGSDSRRPRGSTASVALPRDAPPLTDLSPDDLAALLRADASGVRRAEGPRAQARPDPRQAVGASSSTSPTTCSTCREHQGLAGHRRAQLRRARGPRASCARCSPSCSGSSPSRSSRAATPA